jgi:uncharacterized protein (TIGR03435 family)
LLTIATVSLAQTPPAFEVVSIKPYQETFPFPVPPTPKGPLVTFTGFTVRDLIREAYDLTYDSQIHGFTGWIGNDRFDVSGRVAGDATPTRDQVRVLLQALLAERFSLKFHRETRETPVYALVVAKGGAKIREHIPPESGGGFRPTTKGSQILMKSINAPLDQLVLALVLNSGRPVIDKTGLTGKYDFEYSTVQDSDADHDRGVRREPLHGDRRAARAEAGIAEGPH